MAEYRLTPKAEADLRAIWHYIAADNETAADALFSRLLDKLDLACQHPEMGVARPDLSATARILLVGAYVILYEPMASWPWPSCTACSIRKAGWIKSS